MTETNLKDQLKKLINLQRVDEKIYQVKNELKEKPQQIAALQAAFESKKDHLHALEEKLKEIILKRKEVELELSSKEEEIAKAQTQLSQLKTNKEYSAKISEIESLKADKSIREEKILLFFDECDGVTQEIEKEKGIVSEEEKSFLSQKALVDQEIKDREAQMATLEAERKEILPLIEETFLSRYEQILSRKEGLAIVPVNGGACGGCFMNVTSQTQNIIRMFEEMVECPMCSRILYIEEVL